MATDVSDSSFDAGLIGQSYVPVTKNLLWSGAVDSGAGDNLEGLTLGPRLASGQWVLLGVVDNSNGQDPLSANSVVSFMLASNPSADFNQDTQVNGLDLLAWQAGFGTSMGAECAHVDADRDGDVDVHDLSIWEASYATTAISQMQLVPEANTMALALIGMLLSGISSLHRR